MKNLIILSADLEDKSKGLVGFINSLKKNYSSYYANWRIVIITPEQFQNEKIKIVISGKNIEFAKVKSPGFKNIYLYKTILGDFVASNFSPDEEILYLDYDHICFGMINLPKIMDNEIYTSSEHHHLFLDLLPDKYRSTKIDFHCNTSLIYSRANSIIKISSDWKRIGMDFETSGNSDEIAFTLSAIINDINLKFVSPSIQSNWLNLSQAPLFHYGGHTSYALELKNILSEKKYKSILNSQDIKNELEMKYFMQIVGFLGKDT